MTTLSRRRYTQIRSILVQLPERGKPRASTLSTMLRGRKHRALLLYLLLLTCWPWLEGRRNPLEGAIWIRALTSKDGPTWTASTLSRTWAELADLDLVDLPKKEGRLRRPRPRREDGATEYDVPGGRRDRYNAYFSLPDEFWIDGLFGRLSLPALVMLLVIAKETNSKKTKEVWLPYEYMPDWYGISAKSAQKGITELLGEGILNRRPDSKPAPLSPTGSTTHMYYSLTGVYGHTSRAARRKKAATARAEREAQRALDAVPEP
ncbi:hypothetical protein ACTJKK_12920 [Microbacterium sp. 22179]|uniref:hypothetical protein n=1 Tax=Microbacterium sp. 22179 TaxID=3453886 RepID=UPI003F82C15B